jgi:predicted nucleic acid-binding protein
MIVVDASVLVPALADDGPVGTRRRARLRGARLTAPELIDLEVMSVIRKAAIAGGAGDQRIQQVVAVLLALPLRRIPHRPLLPRIATLRHNLTPYDAAYVALAEAMDVPLVTADARLASATGIACEVELVS